MAESHAKCAEGHICQEPSGRVCCEPGCDQRASHPVAECPTYIANQTNGGEA